MKISHVIRAIALSASFMASAFCFTSLQSVQADEVSILTNLKGEIAIDSTKVAAGEAVAQIALAGTGELAKADIGSAGYIVFRHQATGHWDAHKPLVNLGKDVTYVPNPKAKARFADRLYNSYKNRDVSLVIDGEASANPSQAGALWVTDKDQTAFWDVKAEKGATYTVSVLTPRAGTGVISVANLDDVVAAENSPEVSDVKKEVAKDIASLTDDQGASIVQFEATGSIRIYLSHKAYANKEEKKSRKPAAISAIFFDAK